MNVEAPADDRRARLSGVIEATADVLRALFPDAAISTSGIGLQMWINGELWWVQIGLSCATRDVPGAKGDAR